MVGIHKISIYFILILLSSCTNSKQQQSNAIEEEEGTITTFINQIKRSTQIDTLFNLGLYNLAFETVINQPLTNEDRIHFANRFIDNGEFDKGQYLASLVHSNKHRDDMLLLHIRCALNRQDNQPAEQLMDSLKKHTVDSLVPTNQVKILLYQGYLQHNLKNYSQSIANNLEAIQIIEKNNLPIQFLATAYRRLGNDYNDIVRNKVPFNESRKSCYQKAIDYYKKELALIKKDKPIDKTRVALNYITTAMVIRAYDSKIDLTQYYQNAISNLIVLNNSHFIITRNPVYTSIALTQLAENYYSKGKVQEMDSLLELNKKLLRVRSFYKINSKQSLDIWEYFPQRTQELKIGSKLSEGHIINNSPILLELSNAGKYVNQHLNNDLHEIFGQYANKAIKNWILLNEIFAYHQLQNKRNLFSVEALTRLNDYNKKLSIVIAKNKHQISKEDIASIKKICKEKQTTYLDYQILYGGSMVITSINEDEIKSEWIMPNEVVTKEMIDSLLYACRQNNKVRYKYLALDMSRKLRLTSIKTNNVIICADEYLEKLPFDALLLDDTPAKTWAAFNYLTKTHQIQLIPNLEVLLRYSEATNPMKIDIWISNHDNKTLPYNRQLIKELTDEYGAQLNTENPKHILHIVAHTYRTIDNNIEFRLNQDTLTIFSKGSAKPKLTILEGCSSGDGKNVKLEGSINQTRNFLYNGTPAVIYSIWDADNYSGSVLFQFFYEQLRKSTSAANALHIAKKSLINDYTHPEWANPYYWANYQMIGENQSFTH